MSLITIVIILFCIGKLIDSARIKAQNKQIERVKAEQKRAQKWQRAKAREDAEIAKEMARITKEQERQARQIAKHEEQIAKLEFRMSEAERTIDHYTPLYNTLKRQYDELLAKVTYYESKNLMCGGMKKDLAKVGNQLFTIESKLRKAEFDRDEAERKLSA